MLKIIKCPKQIISVDTAGLGFKRGKEMTSISVIENKSILIENDKIKKLINNSDIEKYPEAEIIDAENKIVLPGLIDCHTHTAYAGSRANEFRMKLAGTDYEEIARMGGGINSTVKAVRESSFDELLEMIKPRIDYFISQGVTSIEIKSGYGLSYYDEIKLLKVIDHLNKTYSIDIYSTFLGAHTFPPEYKNEHDKYISIVTDEMLPYVAENNLAHACDAFCESTAFSADQVDKIFTKAKELGLKVKLHSEQFNNVGGIEVALKHNAMSIDHLEVVNENDINKLAESETVVVLLPGVSFFLDYDFAPARKLIDNGAIVALSTDYNPGSSHIANISMIMGLAALKMKMTIEEIISAYTINAAKALGISDKTGSIEPGKNADLIILNTNEYSDIVYQVGKNLVIKTIKNGEVIYSV